MKPSITRVFADENGETHLAPVDVPEIADVGDGVGRRFALRDIPTTTLSIAGLVGKRPPQGLHPAPRRQFVVLLQGKFEITTTAGDRKRFQPGECLLAEDVEGKGHLFADVGEQTLITMQIGVSADWKVPGT